MSGVCLSVGNMYLSWLLIIVVCVLVLCRFQLFNSSQMKILDIYNLPGKWYSFKCTLVVVFLTIRKFIAHYTAKRDLEPGYGVLSHDFPEEMDKKQSLSEDPKAFDAVYMNGANRIGWYIVVGLARRQLNVDGFLLLKVPGVGLLLSPKLPDTVLNVDEAEDSSFSSEGLKLTPLQPMTCWWLQYKGMMRLSHNPQKKFQVQLDARWQSDLGFFNYDTDMPMRSLAKGLSNETWTKNYFKCLKDHHQTHYEQFGELTGNVIIDNVDFNINMSAMRDHSFGYRREWKAFHRYALHIFTLADGTRGNVGVICIPNMFSRLEIGYVYEKEGSLEPLTDLDFELYQHGENGIPPSDYGFTFKTGHGSCSSDEMAGGRMFIVSRRANDVYSRALNLPVAFRKVDVYSPFHFRSAYLPFQF
ncbi:uncharacterized protein LOC124369363 isoform X2 [Homalodisca vitripennis]|uniref:uncharacterized protein LOC124369363 isoform X2 n=1 Tax=Homalodisca vitripennis TaxID=197043 RepID=UPI001EEB8718|nr:uncharacterized protein LOC124369363 isoform X2 [Homalodisca vitripennis]